MLIDFVIDGSVVILHYADGDCVTVSKSDFDRAFACMVSCPKDIIARDFGLD